VSEQLLYHYTRELAALRRLAGDFARAHPEAAERLRLTPDAVEDPHVSRLLEGVALLNARIREKLDDEFPELTDALLDRLYPHYLAPVPSMAIAEVVCQKDLAAPALVAAGATLESEPVGAEICRFSTTQALTLLPVLIEEATLMSRPFAGPGSKEAVKDFPAALRITLRCRTPDLTFAKLGVDRMRFFVRGRNTLAYSLHELVCSATMAVAVAESPSDERVLLLDRESVRAVGFEPDERMLPAMARSNPAFSLLTELFAFPDKFLCFEVKGLERGASSAGARLQLYLYLREPRAELERLVDAGVLALNCVPIVNLFAQRAEPIRLSRTQSEYRIVPDARRPEALEVYSIDRVTATSPDGETRAYQPFYATTHAGVSRKDARFWYATRRPADETGGGSDSFISLVDLDLDPQLPADWVLSVETTCTNRDLPARLPFGGGHPILRLTQPLATVSAVTAVTAPTPTLRLPSREQGRWRLISHLLLNHLAVTGGEGGADALKELLRLYDFRDSPATRAVIDAILSIDAAQCTARVEDGSGIVCRGLDIALSVSATAGPESGVYVLASVLARLFSLLTTINSFTRLRVTVRDKPGVLYQWPARIGSRLLV
jgi:type VI secretion system protein ImpG